MFLFMMFKLGNIIHQTCSKFCAVLFSSSCSETSLLIIKTVQTQGAVTYLLPHIICFQLPHWIKGTGVRGLFDPPLRNSKEEEEERKKAGRDINQQFSERSSDAANATRASFFYFCLCSVFNVGPAATWSGGSQCPRCPNTISVPQTQPTLHPEVSS